MKICFLGNMNNMPLTYARELRKMGHEVRFFVDAPANEKLHRPEHRYPEYYPYPDWMFDRPIAVPLVAYSFPRIFLARLLRDLRTGGFDGFVLSGLSVSLASMLGGRKFALLAGSDLDVLCDADSPSHAGLVRDYGLLSGTIRYLLLRRFVGLQRRGLRSCQGYSYFPEGINPDAERLLEEIYAGLSPYRLQVRGTDCMQLSLTPPSQRQGAEAIILVAVRFLWKEPLPSNFSERENKRNDIIVQGIADFVAETGVRPRIVFVEKGPDVTATKALAADLGIGDDIEWVPEMSLSEIFEWYRRADIVFEQLGSHVIGAVGLDAMLTGRPVIANGRPDVFDRIIPESSPICQSSNPTEVKDWLKILVFDPQRRAEIGKKSHDYVKKYFNLIHTARAMAHYFAGSPAADLNRDAEDDSTRKLVLRNPACD